MNFEELNATLARATESGFYRKLYALPEGAPPRSIGSIDEWRTVPLLTKKDLLGATLAERSFLPVRDVDYISSSSGTTGSLPLFSPRNKVFEYEVRGTFGVPMRAALSSKPVPHQQERYFSKRSLPPRLVVIDPRNPGATAKLARAAGVDTIWAFLFHVPLIAEHLAREGVAENIRLIEVAGENCSRSQFERMRETFPNATIISTYGLSEIENSAVGVPCKALTADTLPPVYHAKDGVFFELIESGSQKPLPLETGEEGELVITAYRGEPAAFPIIRYCSGDTARVVDAKCPTHGAPSFVILGRIDVDFARVSGGMLKVDEIERVLGSLRERVEDEFELRVSEKGATLFVVPRSAIDLDVLASEIAERLRVSPSTTYADLVRAGTLPPLSCKVLEETKALHKRRRVVRE